jgi:hypothetical protein
MNCLLQSCKENELQVNVTKTKAMYINCDDILNVGLEKVKNVQEFKYLGLILSNNCKKPERLL